MASTTLDFIILAGIATCWLRTRSKASRPRPVKRNMLLARHDVLLPPLGRVARAQQAEAVPGVSLVRPVLIAQCPTCPGNVPGERMSVHALLLAATTNDLAAMCRELNHGADVDAVPFGLCATALFAAIANRHRQAAELLLMRGCLVDKGDNKTPCHTTPLMHASLSGQTEMVRLLVRNKANVNAENSLKQTPLALAAHNGHDECVQLLVDHKADARQMWSAIDSRPRRVSFDF